MNEILKKEQLTKDIFKFVVKNLQVAKKAQPGQFVIIRLTEKGERIPLTIADSNELLGTITFNFYDRRENNYAFSPNE